MLHSKENSRRTAVRTVSFRTAPPIFQVQLLFNTVFFLWCKMKLFQTVFFVFLTGILAASCSIGQKHSATDAYVTDMSITTSVKTALFHESEPGMAQIHVSTCRGTVTLRGEVSEPSQINRAAEVANNVEGVKKVRNHLKTRDKPR